ncbi:MAG: ABC transporter substrate-binding protein [Dehalococcoidia bacterium]
MVDRLRWWRQPAERPAAGGARRRQGFGRGDRGGGSQIQRGGTLRISGATFGETLDPHRSTAAAAAVFALIGNGAVRVAKNPAELEPVLVEKWEIPGDGSEIIMRARPGVKWHNRAPVNGRAFGAEDIAFNLMRIAGKLDPGRVGSYQRRSSLPYLDRVEAVDASTARVKLSAPHSGFMYGLATERNYFIPKELVDAQADAWNDPKTFVGTGAWMYDTFQKDVKATLKPNPDFWERGKPYLDGVEELPLGADRLSWLSAFSQGNVDVMDNVNAAERDTLAKTFKAALPVSWSVASYDHLRFNVGRAPFTDPRVRRAVHLVIDYKDWNDAWYGKDAWDYTGPLAAAFAEAIQSNDVAKLPGWNPATKEQDVKTARDLMAAAGFPNGNVSFKIMGWPSAGIPHRDNAIRAQDNLKRIWPAMDVTLDIPPDTGVATKRSVDGDFDALTYGIYALADPVLDLEDEYGSKGSRNYGRLREEQFDQLLLKASTQLDNAARALTLKQAQDLLINTYMPMVTIAQRRTVTYFAPKIRGLENMPRPMGGAQRDMQLATKDMWFEKK